VPRDGSFPLLCRRSFDNGRQFDGSLVGTPPKLIAGGTYTNDKGKTKRGIYVSNTGPLPDGLTYVSQLAK
jgi:hypothetical protein